MTDLERLKQAEQDALDRLKTARKMGESAMEINNLAFTEWLAANRDYTAALVMGDIRRVIE